MSKRLLTVAAALLGTACAEPVTAIEVRVDARPAARDVATLEVTVANGGQMTSRTFDVQGRSFPLSYTITPTGRTGTLSTSLRAFDAAGALRGTARGEITIVTDEVGVLPVILEPADFVVNAETGGDQVLAYRTGDSGRQLGGSGDRVAVVFVNDCPAVTTCPVLLRVLDKDGVFVGGGDITVNIESLKGSVPAVAVSEDGMLAAWQAEDNSIRAIALSADGAITAGVETVLGSGAEAANPAVAALGSGEYVVVWTQDATGGREIIGRILDAGGAPVGTSFPVSDAVGNPISPSVGASGDEQTFGVAWVEDGQVLVRFYGPNGAAQSADAYPVLGVPGSQAAAVRAAMTPEGDIVVTFSAVGGDAGTGTYALGRFSPPTGVAVHGIIELAAAPSAQTPPSVAIAPDGEMAVAWQGEDAAGAGIYWQRLTAASERIGAPQPVNTTVEGDQTGPSVAVTADGFAIAWTDDSQAPPDTSLRAVRARVLYR